MHIQSLHSVAVAATPLAMGKTIFLDAGHGGKDWGSRAKRPDGSWIGEKTYTLDITMRTAALLKAKGYTVVLSRTAEAPTDQWAVNNPSRDLNGDGEIDGIDDVQARINIANEAHADLLLSIHLNGHELANGQIDPIFNGVTTLYDPDRPFAADNKRFAGLVQEAMLGAIQTALGHATKDWGTADDTTLPTPFTTAHTTYNHDVELGPSAPHWVDASHMPGVISEPLFMTNPDEQAVLLRDDVRQHVAEGYVRAIDAFFAGSSSAKY
ncbi:MAG: N-acetylmuramoyl-L-alanine amidase family protein [Dehalococcoidia bacterium]